MVADNLMTEWARESTGVLFVWTQVVSKLSLIDLVHMQCSVTHMEKSTHLTLVQL